MPAQDYRRPATIDCAVCGNEYAVRPKGRVPRCCSPACNNERQKAIRRGQTRAKLENWSCDLCGKVTAVPHGCQRYCSDRCASRAHSLRQKYGVDVQEFVTLARSQDFRCAICDVAPEEPLHGGLCLDHCHTSLDVRGLLCRMCNSGLGQFKDQPDVLRRAADYLQKGTAT